MAEYIYLVYIYIHRFVVEGGSGEAMRLHPYNIEWTYEHKFHVKSDIVCELCAHMAVLRETAL